MFIRKRLLLRSNATALILFVQVFIASGQTNESSSPYDKLNSDKYLGDYEVITRIQDEGIFTEGPAVDWEGNVYLQISRYRRS